jgi:hypothetical protein
MQRPSALGLFLCDQVILDHETLKPSLIGIFTIINGSRFPVTHGPFEVFSVLTDGQGQVVLELILTCLTTDKRILSRKLLGEFLTPLHTLNVRFRLGAITLPNPGTYLFELHADGEPVCHHRFLVKEVPQPK